VVAHQVLEQHRRLLLEAGIGLLAAEAGERSGQGRLGEGEPGQALEPVSGGPEDDRRRSEVVPELGAPHGR